MTVRMTRRGLLRVGGGGVLAAVALPGCDSLATDPATSGGGGGGGGENNGAATKGPEAPMLAERVKSGDLPAVEDRLPPEPLVVEPVESVGVYGGEWNTMINAPNDVTWVDRTVGYEPLVRWNPEFSDVIPNLAGSFESNAEGTEFTFTLRKGLKWSDGKPFGADDVVFAQNDDRNHPELGSGDDSLRAEKVSDTVVKFISAEPYSLLMHEVAAGWLGPRPKHYLSQFHADYAEDIDAVVEENGEKTWLDLYGRKSESWQNPELPTLNAWVLTADTTSSRLVCERNPYYWKVDPDGSQLPYIDRIVYDVIADAETMVLRTTNGEVDMHVRHINTPDNKPVLADSRESGGYHFIDAPSAWMNTMIIAFNLTSENPVLAEIFNNKDFRIGLSHAMNRKEIINVVYQRTGEPWQAGPRPESELHNERLAKQYTEHDVDLANEHLDRAGYDQRDGEGFRLGPDGNRITFLMDIEPAEPAMVSALNLIKGHWAEVGIEMKVHTIGGTLKFERQISNQHQAIADSGDGGWQDAWLDPRFYLPVNNGASTFAIDWAMWYDTDGEEGTEPPADTPTGQAARDQFDLYRQILATTDPDEQVQLMTQILDIAAETFWVLGTSLPVGGYGIVKDNFHNVPESMPDAWIYPTPGPTRPEQYYISE